MPAQKPKKIGKIRKKKKKVGRLKKASGTKPIDYQDLYPGTVVT